MLSKPSIPQFDLLSAPLQYGDVCIRLLTLEDARELSLGADPNTFKYFLSGVPETVDEKGLTAFLQLHLSRPIVPFAVTFQGKVVGSSSYLDLKLDQGWLEIGYTWYNPSVRGTVVNPTVKFLMLSRGFEEMNLQRIQLKCDKNNERSRNAILKLGAKFEGTLRNHRRPIYTESGDTDMFSILDSEWPEVRKGLLARIS